MQPHRFKLSIAKKYNIVKNFFVFSDELFWLPKILKVSADELLGGIEDSDEKI